MTLVPSGTMRFAGVSTPAVTVAEVSKIRVDDVDRYDTRLTKREGGGGLNLLHILFWDRRLNATKIFAKLRKLFLFDPSFGKFRREIRVGGG
jgi:hypothetical protein